MKFIDLLFSALRTSQLQRFAPFKRLKLLRYALCITVLVSGCQNTPVQRDQTPQPVLAHSCYYELAFPSEQSVQFYGKQDAHVNGNGQGGGMMYPGYNAGGFLASVLVHAMVQGGVNSARESAAQEEADKVVSSYETVIQKIDTDWLMPDAVTVSVNDSVSVFASVPPGDDVGVEHCRALVTPAFLLTQNQKSLILDNKIDLAPPHSTVEDNAHMRTVRVYYVDSPATSDPTVYWSESDYENFRESVRSVFSESLKLAIRYSDAIESQDAVDPTTIRYLEGGEKKVERGVVIDSSCTRLVFVSLRGAIKSVPRLTAQADACERNLPSVEPSVVQALRFDAGP